MEAYFEGLEKLDNYISKCLLNDNEIADMQRRNIQVTVLLKSIVAEEKRQSTPLGTFGWLVRLPWLINYPPCLLDSAVNPHLRTAYDIAVGIQTAGIISKLLQWPFHGGWPWQWTLDLPLMLILLGYWGTHVGAFAAGYREVSTVFLLQLAFFVVITWRHVFPNWWDYRWELSFVFPVGFLCYTVWHRLGLKETFQENFGH